MGIISWFINQLITGEPHPVDPYRSQTLDSSRKTEESLVAEIPMRTKKQLGPLESMIHSDEDGPLDVSGQRDRRWLLVDVFANIWAFTNDFNVL
jgi:hypothetical protein